MKEEIPAGFLNHFHIVLVEPENSLNIGAVARAMMNLGCPNLHLVAPRDYDRAVARVTACWAEPLLDNLHIHTTFEEAIADMQDVVGLSGRTGNNNLTHFISLPAWSADLSTRPFCQTALVFGPEDNGLRQEHLNCCRRVVHIPATAAVPSYNLAQSVLLVLYEITRTLSERETNSVSVPDLPTGNEQYQLDRLLDTVMRTSGFVREGTPRPVPGTVKNLFRRLEMNRQEMGILLGLLGKINQSLLWWQSRSKD